MRGSRLTFARGFWTALILLVLGTLGLLAAAALQIRAPQELSQEQRESLFAAARQEAVTRIEPGIDAALDRLFAPVHAAIPAYADFHYSVLGQYTELGQAAFGQTAAAMHDRLFADFDTRLQHEVSGLDTQLGEIYRKAIGGRLDGMRHDMGTSDIDFGPLTQAARDEALQRFALTAPLATVTATAIATGAAKTLSTALAKKLLAMIASKTAVQAGGKLAASLGGAGGGALLCSWAGPGAALCGLAGGVVTWFAVDTAVIHLDEYFRRDAFEAEIARMVDDSRAELRSLLITALNHKAEALDGSAPLRDQTRPAP